MRIKLILFLFLFIFIGCSKEPIDLENLNFRNEKYYPINSDKPYSGPTFTLYENGQLQQEVNLKKGKKHGPFKTYYSNGQLESESTYKDGKEDGLWKTYNYDGQLKLEETYKDGELIETKRY